MPPDRATWVDKLTTTVAELAALVQSAEWLPAHHRDAAMRDINRIVRSLEQET